jgi:hypothetical protein
MAHPLYRQNETEETSRGEAFEIVTTDAGTALDALVSGRHNAPGSKGKKACRATPKDIAQMPAPRIA